MPEPQAAHPSVPESTRSLHLNGESRPRTAEQDAPRNDDVWLRDLRLFFRTGRRPSWASRDLATDRLLPVPLYPFRDLARMRGPYPLLLADDSSEVHTLTLLMDAAVENTGQEGDEAARTTHALHRLEVALRTRVGTSGEGRLAMLWEEEAAALVARTPSDRRTALRAGLDAARAALPDDGLLIDCVPGTAQRLLGTFWREARSDAARSFVIQADDLAARIADILAVDASHRPDASTPDHLQAALDRDIDVEALAHLLEDQPLGDPLPEARRRRLRDVLETLRRAPGLLDASPAEPVATCTDAVEHLAERRDALVALVRALHVARLEVDNRYRDEVHDPLFEAYTWADLTEDERALCPPVLLVLDEDAVADELGEIVELLGSGLPVKVLLPLHRACDVPVLPGTAACTFGAPARLATMATTLGGAYVLQTPASNVETLEAGFVDGVRYPGPALFCVFEGDAAHAASLPPYLRAAVGGESRAVPSFILDPAAGADWADRFRLTANAEPERPWPTSTVVLDQQHEGSEEEAEAESYAFTFADFLACDDRFSAHFLSLDPDRAHDALVPLADFLATAFSDTDAPVPYLAMTSDDGTLHRVVVTEAVVRATRDAAARWRSLQELGGIDNSHVRSVRADLEDTLEARHRDALDAERERHRTEMDRATSELAREIVANIAAGLLELPAQAGPAPAVRTAPPPSAPAPASETAPVPEVATPEVATPEASAEAEEEDEPLSFDEAYVETPRCTTCNECTNLNGQLFAYDENKQAYIKDLSAGTYRDLVVAAEKCPVGIIHPGKPQNPDEPGLDDLLERAQPFM